MANIVSSMWRLVVCLTMILGFFSCSDDGHSDDSGSVDFDESVLFVSAAGQTASINLKLTNVDVLSVYSAPSGWTVVVDLDAKTITATAPADFEGENVSSGIAILTGLTHGGNPIVSYLDVAVASREDITYRQSNSMLITTGNTMYSFNPRLKAEQSDETLATKYVELLWQTEDAPIGSVELMDDGTAEFYVRADEDNQYKAMNGNAVIVARNSSKQIIWSWHIWSVADMPSEVTIGGVTFMGCNLGAFSNTNVDGDDVEEDEDYETNHAEILDSYGLFYEWGRKEPFIGPFYYNSASSSDAATIDIELEYVEMQYIQTSSIVGTLSYAEQNPLTYIYSGENGGDWIASSDNSLWNSDQKSIYDPSPRGWRIPKMADLEALTVQYNANSEYGVYLGDGSTQELFMAAGRRTYLTGELENIDPLSSKLTPWAGYYWTRDGGAWIFNAEQTIDGANVSRANGLQIRCVKDL